MKRLIALLLGVFAISVLPAAAAEQPQIHKTTLTVTDQIVIGGTTLKAGEYKFECRMTDGKEMMYFIDNKGVEVAKAPCTPTTLPQKVQSTEYRTRNNADGTKTLTSVRIKNETIAHTVATN